jgi:UDPglucose--hexose-1-phosphate uridylyltransferase
MSGEFRYDPHLDQWVNIVGHRQGRPLHPADDDCPFCPGGLEAPEDFDVRWFPNRWPALTPGAAVRLGSFGAEISVDSFPVLPVPASGATEVVLYSPNHHGSLASLGQAQVRKVVDLWAERTAELLARPEVEYVLIFESRGEEVGATIHHPHGQIYGYPIVPPLPAQERRIAQSHWEHDLDVVVDELEDELADGRRIVFDDGDWVGWVPQAAPAPFAVRLAPRDGARRLDELGDGARNSMAAALVDVIGRYDRLWAGDPARSPIFPYLMWIHQAPATIEPWDRLHVHLTPPQRAPGLLRYVAAGELGSGMFSNPVVPEEAAELLRSV